MHPLPHLSSIACCLLLSCVQQAGAYKKLSNSFLRAIPSPGSDFDTDTGSLLAPILVPRVPGTSGHAEVQEHFVSFFRKELPQWTITFQNSTSKTPVTGDEQIPFTNLIFRREPPWLEPGQSSLLTLVAHYDSKREPEGFIGATDSAAPCAMLMHVARSIDQYMTRMHIEIAASTKERTAVNMNMGIQILLLDGEEAFDEWTDEDSLYGSRSLAKTWSSTYNAPTSGLSHYRTPLSQISLFMLLDLLGAANPKIPSHFLETHWAYRNFAAIEARMRALDLLESRPKTPFLPDINRMMRAGKVMDDHIPFLLRGVPVLHVIPSPFPSVWHTLDDDGDHLDMPTTRDWAKIVTAFALEWLDMMDVWDEPEEEVLG